MKKIMVLGAAHAQMPLIDAAERLGYHTIVASTPGAHPGFLIADGCCHTDISDPAGILLQAKRYQVDGIVTCGMDIGVRALGRVCDEMHLAGLTESAAVRATDKALSMESFAQAGIDHARSVKVHDRQELEEALDVLGFPAVLKAVDLMGSRGIYRCDTMEQAQAAYGSIQEESAQGYCLAEEFLEGVLFGAEGMITEGELDFLLPYGTKVYHGTLIPTSVGHWAPLDLPVGQEEIWKVVVRALQALGIRTSPFNCDLLLKDGKIYLIEVNARAGASFLSETVSIYYGIDYYEILCRQAVGERVRDHFALEGRRPRASVSQMIISEKTGILENVKIPDTQDNSHIEKMDLYVKTKGQIRAYRDGRDTAGYVIVKGDSVQECRGYMEEILAEICLEVR